MTKEKFKISLLLMGFILGALYLGDMFFTEKKPDVAKASATNLGFVGSSSTMTASVRAGLMVALERIRTEMVHTTNTVDLEALRAAETTLTNALARP
jgi:hypothetical protein